MVTRRRLLQLALLLPLLFAYAQSARILLNDGWQLCEVNLWGPQLRADGFPDSVRSFGRALNWELLEYVPRMSRPLGNVIQLFDTPFRAWLWRFFPVPPSLSLTWPISLIVSPLLLVLLLRRLGVERWIAILAAALYVASPGVLSQEAMFFRPGKTVANAAILFCLYLAAGLDRTRQQGHRIDRRFTGLLALVPVANNVTDGNRIAMGATPVSGAAGGLSPTGTTLPLPASTGSAFNAPPLTPNCASKRLGDLVTPVNDRGQYDPSGSFVRPGASTIYREQGHRFIAIKFEVRNRDLASAVAEAHEKVTPFIQPPYRAEWSGEFRQMEQAERRLARMFAVSMALILLLLYLAFRSALDAGVVIANVLAMGVGGVWALKLAQLHFNISAAVGFISILGVAVMNGLLFVSALNGLRARGIPLSEALLLATRQLVRPILMTALAAMLGLLPAALSHQMGSESQKPLAVVVVGGMIATILCVNLIPLLYSFYGHREPPEGADGLAH